MDLLIVEDEVLLGRAIERGLTEAGHRCTWARTGSEGVGASRQRPFDAVVLDVMLPDLDGFSVLAALRGDGVQTPVLFLTALGAIDDRVKGLNAGADDYLVKPFDFPELLARLNALGRRLRPAARLEAGSLTLDLSTRKARDGDHEIDLSPTEFSLLELLMRFAGQVVTRKMLNEHLWGEDWGSMTNVIDVHINRLRKKIDRGQEESRIQTVRGRGYVIRTA